MKKLIIETGPQQGRSFNLTQNMISIGRGPVNTFQILDKRLSRSHAAIFLEDGKHTIRDLGSTNGTKVNSEKVEEVVLEHGDKIQLGGVVLVYCVDEANTNLEDETTEQGEYDEN